jgi:glutathione S-transferase
MSPFCVKVETYLKMTDIPYKVKGGTPLRGPKGKIPYINDDGVMIGDSDLIIQHLIKKHGDTLDKHLSPQEKSHSLALRRLMEEHAYFAIAWLRWSDQHSWTYVRDFIKPAMPPVIGPLILKKLRSNFLRAIRSQGMGRHTRDEIIQFAKADLQAVSDWLGENKFFMGDKPSSVDATMYGFLIQSLWVPWSGEVEQYARSLQNLEDYCQRMKKKYWQNAA